MRKLTKRQLNQLNKNLKTMVQKSQKCEILPQKQSGPILTNFINGRPAEEYDNWHPQKDRI